MIISWVYGIGQVTAHCSWFMQGATMYCGIPFDIVHCNIAISCVWRHLRSFVYLNIERTYWKNSLPMSTEYAPNPSSPLLPELSLCLKIRQQFGCASEFLKYMLTRPEWRRWLWLTFKFVFTFLNSKFYCELRCLLNKLDVTKCKTFVQVHTVFFSTFFLTQDDVLNSISSIIDTAKVSFRFRDPVFWLFSSISISLT